MITKTDAKSVLRVFALIISSSRCWNLLSGGTHTSLAIKSDSSSSWCTLASINDGNLLCSTWYHSGSMSGGWVSIQMSSTNVVNTILYVAAEHEFLNCCPERNVQLQFRVGADHGPTTNHICVPGPIQRTGWYQCTVPLTGLHVSVNQAGGPNEFHAVEMLAYSEFTIQMNAKQVTMSSVAPNSNPNFVLRMGYIDAWNGTAALCSTTNTENYPSLTITMKAQTQINRIVLVPNVCFGGFKDQVLEVFLDSYAGVSFKCGDSSPSVTYNFEFDCGTTSGYQVRVKSKTTNSVLKLCSVGILSRCDCSQTSLLQDQMPDYGARIATNAVVANYNGAAVTVQIKTQDSVSYVCGTGDGLAYCGPRTIKFHDPITGFQVTPAFLSFNAVAGALSIQSTSKSEVATHQFDIKLTLTNFPFVIQAPYPLLTVTILAECVDTTFEPFVLLQSPLSVDMFTNSTRFAITLPKDSASNVQTIQDGYSYCSASRTLMAQIDGGAAFVVNMESETILYDKSQGIVFLAPMDMKLVGDHTLYLWLILASYPTVQTNRNPVAFTVVDMCPFANLTGSSQEGIYMTMIARTGISLSEVLGFPNDTLSLSLGYQVCGEILVSFLNEKRDEIDLSTTSFLRYDSQTRTVTAQSFSIGDAGTYNYTIQFKLANYPAIISSTPFSITIYAPLTIFPTPLSSYTIAPGDNLTLSFEIFNPQNIGITIDMDTGLAKKFASTEIEMTSFNIGSAKITFSPSITLKNFKSPIKLTAKEIFDAQNCPNPQIKQVAFSLFIQDPPNNSDLTEQQVTKNNTAPYFLIEPKVPDPIPCLTSNSSLAWQYKTSSVIDQEKDLVSYAITCSGVDGSFFIHTFEDQALKLILNQEYQGKKPSEGSLTCFILLNDNNGASKKYKLTFSIKCKPPEPIISEIDQSGKVIIKWSALMVVPNVSKTQSDCYKSSPISVKVVPGSNVQSLTDFNFTFVVTELSQAQTVLQLTFSNPNLISINKHQEQILIEFTNPSCFVSEASSLQVIKTTVLMKNIPRQKSGSIVEMPASLAASFKSSTTLSLAASIANLLFQGFLNSLLSIVTSIGIILHMFLVKLNYPVQLLNFFGFMFPLITFDAIPVSKLYERWFHFADIKTDRALTEQFSIVGYSSMFLVQNIGSLFLIINLQLALFILLWLLRRYKPFRILGPVQRIIDSFANSVLWSGGINFFAQNYLVLCVVSYIQATDFQLGHESNQTEKICSSLAIMGIAFSVLFPILIFWLYRSKLSSLVAVFNIASSREKKLNQAGDISKDSRSQERDLRAPNLTDTHFEDLQTQGKSQIQEPEAERISYKVAAILGSVEHKQFVQTYGLLIQGLRLKNIGPLYTILTPIFDFMFKLVIAIGVTLLVNWPTFTIFMFNFGIICYLQFVLYVQPHEDKIDATRSVFNLISYLVLNYHLITLTNYADNSVYPLIATSVIYLVWTSILVNFALVLSSYCRWMSRKLKMLWMRRKYRTKRKQTMLQQQQTSSANAVRLSTENSQQLSEESSSVSLQESEDWEEPESMQMQNESDKNQHEDDQIKLQIDAISIQQGNLPSNVQSPRQQHIRSHFFQSPSEQLQREAIQVEERPFQLVDAKLKQSFWLQKARREKNQSKDCEGVDDLSSEPINKQLLVQSELHLQDPFKFQDHHVSELPYRDLKPESKFSSEEFESSEHPSISHAQPDPEDREYIALKVKPFRPGHKFARITVPMDDQNEENFKNIAVPAATIDENLLQERHSTPQKCKEEQKQIEVANQINISNDGKQSHSLRVSVQNNLEKSKKIQNMEHPNKLAQADKVSLESQNRTRSLPKFLRLNEVKYQKMDSLQTDLYSQSNIQNFTLEKPTLSPVNESSGGRSVSQYQIQMRNRENSKYFASSAVKQILTNQRPFCSVVAGQAQKSQLSAPKKIVMESFRSGM